MKKKESLTNEQLTSELPNKFRLARVAINLAHHHIQAGQDFTVGSLLDDLKKHPSFLSDMEVEKAS